MRVLVVEDEEALGKVFADYLHELGHQPLLARSAEAALDPLMAASPDAIILDMSLPGMSGLEFLQLPQVRAAAIPVVAVSGVATEDQAHASLELGAIDFLAKPVHFERLRALLEFLEIHTQQYGALGRRVPRLAVPIQVLVRFEVEWTAIDLSPFGVKVPRQAWLEPGATVSLSFALPDGGPPVGIKAVLVRTDPGGDLFSFVNLSEAEFHRIADFCHGATSDGAAIFRVGLAYEFGKGMARDRAEAVRSYRRAAALGDERAAQRLRALGEEP